MTLQIRDFTAADAAAAAACYQAGRPYLMTTAEVVAWQVKIVPADLRYRLLLAELDGVVVGSARCSLIPNAGTPNQAELNVSVLPEYRGKGAGGALLAAGEEYLRGLGATHLHGWGDEDEASLAVTGRYGYRAGRASQIARLDLTGELPPVPALPPGVQLRTGADYLDDPRPIYLLDEEGLLDEPGDLELDTLDYGVWYDMTWSRPDQQRELTIVVLADGEPAALTTVQSDGGTRYWSAGTSTRPRYRGRGLAKLAKLASLHRAKAAGLTEAFTNNDAENLPMLAVNNRLGYTPYARQFRLTKEL
ncbi:GNAT family N-acetyltransferase [Kitasatospora sp. NBC_01287]|uniref:GNAT family N-acetyltransferase n=1 Tax=Kitasatospora sp. NBC_01287 TaxID=2903573 RepID=UPI00225285A1|nr:GNAT family N-acetyltransferase [Kitasatospora sp. NBC_01287]MCX4749763.1 GNAT family N-acetyltransferase [Kitasatospora sp. NBC_01287]